MFFIRFILLCMQLRHRYVVIAVRTLFGLFLLMSGVTGLMAGMRGMQGVPEPMIPASQHLWDVGIFQMIKTTEVVAGLMLVAGFLPALAAIFIAPIAVGIIVFTSRVAPSLMPTGIIICLFDAYLGYVYWDKYKALFTRP